jgi:hypothetical protein
MEIFVGVFNAIGAIVIAWFYWGIIIAMGPIQEGVAWLYILLGFLSCIVIKLYVSNHKKLWMSASLVITTILSSIISFQYISYIHDDAILSGENIIFTTNLLFAIFSVISPLMLLSIFGMWLGHIGIKMFAYFKSPRKGTKMQ